MENYISKSPVALRTAFKKIADLLPVNISLFRRFQKVIANIDKTATFRMAGYFSWIPYHRLKKIFLQKYEAELNNYDPLNNLTELIKEIPSEKNLLNQMLYMEMKSFMVDHNLNYTDKLSMAEGVEVRVPYLDRELVEFSTTIPPKFKMKGKKTKYLLRKVAERYLPLNVIYRPKTGFGAPVRKWIISDLEPIIANRLSYQKISESGIFDPNEVWKLIKDNKDRKIDGAYTILSLLVIESWMKQFADNGPQS
jgi:asparagine synthase (glutamine-hydrolysing)